MHNPGYDPPAHGDKYKQVQMWMQGCKTTHLRYLCELAGAGVEMGVSSVGQGEYLMV